MAKKQILEGYRVVDFGWVWAGTVLGQILADHGAEVIKIESKKRLDGLRLGKVFELGETLEVNTYFHNLNRNKLSITVDISQPKGAELIKELVKKSHIVVENFTPSVLNRYGLDYPSLIKVKPDIVMISMSPAGQRGPLSQIVAYAPIITALSGIDSMVGYPDSEPMGFKHAYGDVTASLSGAFAVLAAMRYHARTGKGQHIDMSQIEITTSLIGEGIMDYTMNSRGKGTQGNYSPNMAPHGNYPCKEDDRGDDKWVSIAVKTEGEWRNFCKAIGNPSWCADPKFADRRLRLANSAELDKYVTQWTSNHTDYEVAEILQKEGVAATPVLTTADIFLDPHYNQRRSFVDVEHPISGGTAIYDLPWKFSGITRKKIRHAPLLGEHNDYVFGEILGLPKEKRDKLVEENIIY
ncbi:CaiB/BaiF CoA transferase family protein [Chloroflexota bacterium]